MERLLVIDGNSIINRAFYGILGNKMLMTADGKYTNAIYGFLSIMFKIIDDLNPDYLAIAFDLKSPTKRHKLYKEYKGTRKGMPDELAEQMPILKEILRSMNIKIIEKEEYEADDILGTLANIAAKENINVTILSGDRDTFQLVNEKINVRIPYRNYWFSDYFFIVQPNYCICHRERPHYIHFQRTGNNACRNNRNCRKKSK